MKRIVSIAAVFLCGISLLQAQLLRVSDALKELKMENISVVAVAVFFILFYKEAWWARHGVVTKLKGVAP